MALVDGLADGLAQRRSAGLYRRRAVANGPQAPLRVLDGEALLSFSSNDYLGLAADPRVAQALADGAAQYGVGAGASHLLGGHTRAHHELEAELADWTARPRALLFSTGYMANLGVIGALLGRADTVLEDRLNHASLLDAATLSRARLGRYRHGDMADLAGRLAAVQAGVRLIATDAVFSMDGDLAPLAQLADLAASHGAWLLADDAHGLGVLGPQGAGSVAAAGLDADRVPVLMGTLGKALGTFGAFVAGDENLIETLIQHARSYIYTTALPPALAVATLTAVRLARTENWRRDKVLTLVGRLRAGAAQLGLPLMPSDTPIQPLRVGDTRRVLALSEALRARGLWVPAVRPPTVPVGSARLRITLSAAHTEAQLDRLLETLAAVWGSVIDE